MTTRLVPRWPTWALSATVCCGAAPLALAAATASAVNRQRVAEAIVQLSDIAAGQGGFVVNGDGPSDFLVGTYRPAGLPGTNYLVFGKTSGAAIDLSDVASGVGGFVIRGPSSAFNHVAYWSRRG